MVTRTAGGRRGVGVRRGARDRPLAHARASASSPERLADRGVQLRGVMEDVGEERREMKLPCREALDDAHDTTTAGARPRR
jgi:hypothetical protein